MSDIDRQRIAGVKTLLALQFTWHQGRWVQPAPLAVPLLPEADALHALLVDRADQLILQEARALAVKAGATPVSQPSMSLKRSSARYTASRAGSIAFRPKRTLWRTNS